LALNAKGIEQNKVELKNAADPKLKKLVTDIYDYSPDYRWIVAELARPFNNDKDFEHAAGFPFEEIGNQLKSTFKPYTRNQLKGGARADTGQISNPLIGKLADIVQENDFMIGDLKRLSSWGKTADGRAVLLDYGFTDDVWKNHYKDTMPNRPDGESEGQTAVPSGQDRTGDREHSDYGMGDTTPSTNVKSVSEPVSVSGKSKPSTEQPVSNAPSTTPAKIRAKK
jgi:hypothetical protein